MGKINFLTRLRYDANTQYGVTDLCGNSWKTHNSSKTLSASDPFGGNNAITIKSFGGFDMLSDNNNKLYNANNNYTICFWYYHDGSYSYTGNDIWVALGQSNNNTWFVELFNWTR